MPKAAIPPHSLLTAATDGSERYPAQPARVSLVDSHGVWTGTVCASELLRTRVLAAADAEPASYRPVVARLCEHFEGHGTCNRGHKCRFAHRVGPAKPSGGPLHNTGGAETKGAIHIASMRGRSVVADGTARNPLACPSADGKAGTSRRRRTPPAASHDAGSCVTPSRATPREGIIVISRGGRCWRHAAYDATPLGV